MITLKSQKKVKERSGESVADLIDVHPANQTATKLSLAPKLI
jgi:hypothetical protein